MISGCIRKDGTRLNPNLVGNAPKTTVEESSKYAGFVSPPRKYELNWTGFQSQKKETYKRNASKATVSSNACQKSTCISKVQQVEDLEKDEEMVIKGISWTLVGGNQGDSTKKD